MAEHLAYLPILSLHLPALGDLPLTAEEPFVETLALVLLAAE